VLGGSSSINGMVYVRGHAEDFDTWERMGAKGWGYRHVLPYFKRSEGNQRGAGPWHGGKGEVKVRPARPELPICEAFLAAAGMGFPILDHLNRDTVDGFGYYDINVGSSRRMSTATAFL
jgi:choline dehydrogenase